MNSLPHPFASTNPGDIFYPGFPHVVVPTAPGSQGSYCIEFGEDGTGASANRGFYAAAKNAHYLWTAITRKMAKPALLNITPGAPIGSYQFTGVDVFVGDSTYLPETQDILNRLVTILDDKFNELTNSDGDRVVAYEIRDSADTVSIVGDPAPTGDEDGFYTGPIIKFKTQNPFTGALGGAYNIPAGSYYLAFGTARRLEDLSDQSVHTPPGTSTPEYMRDAFFRNNRYASVIPAGAFLTDGSRKMRGALDLDAYGVTDDSASAPIPWTQPEYPALNDHDGMHGSVIGDLTSKTFLAKGMHGNRVLTHSGAFSFVGATKTVTWPDMHVALNGQHLAIASGSLVTAATDPVLLVVDVGGNVVEREQTGAGAAPVTSDELLLAFYQHDGTSTFTFSKVCIWEMSKGTEAFDITVGSAEGCDFSGDLSGILAALGLIDAMSMALAFPGGGGRAALSSRIRIKGKLTLENTVTFDFNSSAPPSIIFEGDGISSSEIETDGATFPTSGHLFDCRGCNVHFRNITFRWNGATKQDALRGAITDPGSYSTFQRLQFTKGSAVTKGFTDCILWTSYTSSPVEGVLTRDIVARYITGSVLAGADPTFGLGDAYVNDSLAENIILTQINVSAPVYGVVLPGDRNTVRNFKVNDHGMTASAVVIGAGGMVDGCRFRQGNLAYGSAKGVAVKPHVTGTSAKITIRDTQVEYAGEAITGVNSAAGVDVIVEVSGCRFLGCGVGVGLMHVTADDNSNVCIEGSTFLVCDAPVALSRQKVCTIRGNRMEGTTGTGIYAAYGRCVIDGNQIDYGTGVADYAIQLAGSTASSWIVDNLLDDGQLATNGQIRIESEKTHIVDNEIGGDHDTAEVMVHVLGDKAFISGNHFHDGLAGAIYLDSENAGIAITATIAGNLFEALEGRAIRVEGTLKCKIRGNIFASCECGIAGVDSTTYALGNTTIEGNDFSSCGTVAIPGSVYSAVVWLDRATAGSYRALIRGNLFEYTGNSGGGTNYCIYANKDAQVCGNDFVGVVGDYSTDDTFYFVQVKGAGKVNGNVFVVDPAQTGIPETITCIDLGTDGSKADNNHFQWTPSGALPSDGLADLRGVVSTKKYISACDNTFDGTDVPGNSNPSGGASPVVYYVSLTGVGCRAVGNILAQPYGATAVHYFKVTGTGSLVRSNVFPSTVLELDLGSNFGANAADACIDYYKSLPAGGGTLVRAGTTAITAGYSGAGIYGTGPTAGKESAIVGIDVTLSATLASGTLTATVYVDGAPTAVLVDVTASHGYASHTGGVQVGNDKAITVEISGSYTVSGGGSVEIAATVYLAHQVLHNQFYA